MSIDYITETVKRKTIPSDLLLKEISIKGNYQCYYMDLISCLMNLMYETAKHTMARAIILTS